MANTLHKIRQIREARGMSQQQLGELVGRTKGVISRIESGETSLDLEMATKIAGALGCSLAEVLAIEAFDDRNRHATYQPGGFYEDELTAYTASGEDPLAGMVTPNRYLMVAQSNALERMGIRAGDRLLIDDSAKLCSAPPPLAAVYVNFMPDAEADRSVALLRQFVPPSLLVTNRGAKNDPSLDMTVDEVTIVGVIVWSGRSHA